MSSHLRTRTMTPARSASLLAGVILAIACATIGLNTATAYAGTWVEVSCENPNLSAAPNEGWTDFAAGGGNGSNTDTSCAPGNPMFAILSTNVAVPVGSDETLQYTPPGGSALAGGSVDIALNGEGYGDDASGTAIAYSPEYAYNGSNVILQCSAGQPACASASTPYKWAGVLALPSNRGGDFYLSAGCGGTGGQACDVGGSEGAWSLVRLWWADFLLSNNSTPAAGAFSGALLGGYLGTLHPIVELQVKYLGGWRVFQTLRCKNNGAFKTTYKFLGATGLFPFRARVRAATGRPYTLGYSPTHAIRAE
jgi:hypothetical protein